MISSRLKVNAALRSAEDSDKSRTMLLAIRRDSSTVLITTTLNEEVQPGVGTFPCADHTSFNHSSVSDT